MTHISTFSHFPSHRFVARGDDGVRITELARSLGVTARTLRYYEGEGLIQPKRTDGNVRVYGPAARAQAEQVLSLSRLGFGSHEMRELLSEEGRQGQAVFASRLQERLKRLDDQRALIVKSLDELGLLAQAG